MICMCTVTFTTQIKLLTLCFTLESSSGLYTILFLIAYSMYTVSNRKERWDGLVVQMGYLVVGVTRSKISCLLWFLHHCYTPPAPSTSHTVASKDIGLAINHIPHSSVCVTHTYTFGVLNGDSCE